MEGGGEGVGTSWGWLGQGTPRMSCELGLGEAKTSRGAGGRWRRSQTPEPADEGPGRMALKVRQWAGAPRGRGCKLGLGSGRTWNSTQLGFLEARGVPVLPGAPDRPRHWVSYGATCSVPASLLLTSRWESSLPSETHLVPFDYDFASRCSPGY